MKWGLIFVKQEYGVAMDALKALTASGPFIGQPAKFFTLLHNLAEMANAARHG